MYGLKNKNPKTLIECGIQLIFIIISIIVVKNGGKYLYDYCMNVLTTEELGARIIVIACILSTIISFIITIFRYKKDNSLLENLVTFAITNFICVFASFILLIFIVPIIEYESILRFFLNALAILAAGILISILISVFMAFINLIVYGTLNLIKEMDLNIIQYKRNIKFKKEVKNTESYIAIKSFLRDNIIKSFEISDSEVIFTTKLNHKTTYNLNKDDFGKFDEEKYKMIVKNLIKGTGSYKIVYLYNKNKYNIINKKV